MGSQAWGRIILDALGSLDPRTPHIVLPIEDLAESRQVAVTRRDLTLWTDFELPVLVVPDVSQEIAATAGAAMLDGPILLDLGFRGDSPRRQREREEAIVAALGSIADTSGAGVIAVVVPGVWLASTGRTWQRSQLTHAFQLRYVISAYGVVDGISSSFQMACLVFSHPRELGEDTVFFEFSPRSIGVVDPVEDFASLNAGASVSALGYRTLECFPGGDSLAFDARNPELLTRQGELAQIGNQVAVRELFDVLRSRPIIRDASTRQGPADGERGRSADFYVDPSEAGAIREVNGRDVHADGIAPANGDTRYRLPLDGDVLLQPGDLVLRAITGNRRAELTAGMFTEGDGEALAGQHVIVLRPKPETDHRVVLATQLFLHSEVAARVAGSRSGSTIALSPSTVATLEVPIPDTPTLDAITNVVEVRMSLSEWVSEADHVLKTLYRQSDVVAAKEDIQDASRTLRARVNLGAALDDPYELYRTAYPFPIAYRWRMVEAAYSSPDRDKALREIHEAAEVTLAYAACMALVFARNHGLDLACLKEVRSKLSSGRSGLGFGDWVNILNEATLSREAKRIPLGAPLSEVRQFFGAEGVEGARARLKKQRDADAHGRHPTGPDLQDAIEAAYSDLITLLNAAAPLSDIGLLHIDRARIDTLRTSSRLTYRHFRGDHPVIRSQQDWFEGMHYEEDSLYLRDTEGHMHLLRPYMLANACPTCHNWTMFAIDRVIGGVPEYKSLDHTHTEQQPDSIDALIHVGLLSPA